MQPRAAIHSPPFLCLFACSLACASTAAAAGEAAPPRVLLPGYGLELVAESPDIVTPVGMAFDARGRLLVIESHTHERQDDYEGPSSDRLQLFYDSDGDGRLDDWKTFAEGFTAAMNIAVRAEGSVLLTTRSALHLLEDQDGDDHAERNEVVVQLDTTNLFSHNGLSGLAIAKVDGDETVYLGLGENHGIEYSLRGSDGSVYEGTDTAGAVFTCRPDGSRVQRFATGFWNPFGLSSWRRGLFCIDNDPDASPPCRLLHVQPRGDYGYRYQYGRSGLHPLQAWNGELPGTLPMMAGTGEAPTGIVAHEGALWVTSWGEHRIERYVVREDDAGRLVAEQSLVVQGNADFRPTGIAVAPDGSLYFGDWLLRDYPVHGAGRLWRLTLPTSVADNEASSSPWPEAPEDASGELRELMRLKWLGGTPDAAMLREALASEDADVRLYAVRWIADDHLTEYSPDIRRLLDDAPPSERYYLAVLAAIDWLSREPEPRSSNIADGLLARELRNSRRPSSAHTLALQLISPDHKVLTQELMDRFLGSEDLWLRREAVRTLAQQSRPGRFDTLAQIAQDPGEDEQVRADAVAGLAAAADEYKPLLKQLAAEPTSLFGREAARVLRLSGLSDQPPVLEDRNDEGFLRYVLEEGGDAESGRRLFFSSVGSRCATCHQHGGRGGQVGPDLTTIGQSTTRERIVRSILHPSEEVAPQYQAWTLLTSDGKTRVGLRLPRPGDTGVEYYVDAEGNEFQVRSEEVEFREASQVSLMPEGLEKTVSREDFRDLVAFLCAPRED
ncbi:MAG: PVC-type heme-binding CxxCH protein [Planctomycetota bacterium]